MVITKEEAMRRLGSSRNLANLAAPGLPSSSPTSPAPEPVSSSDFDSQQDNEPQDEVQESNVDHRVFNARKTKGPNVSEKTRERICEMAWEGKHSEQEIAEMFGVTFQSVNQYKHGQSSSRPPTEARKAVVLAKIDKAKDAALDKLMLSLGLMQGADLAECKPKELSAIAANMAKVHNSLESKSSYAAESPVKLVIFAPEQRLQSRFKVLDV